MKTSITMAIILFSVCIIALIGCSYYQTGSDTINNNDITKPGAKVLIMLSDGEEYTGELLTIRDSIMIMCERHNAREKDLADSVFSLFSLKNRDIRYIEIKGSGNALYGIIFGGVAGGLIGAAVYKSEDEEEKKPDENSFIFNFNINLDPVRGCCIGGFIGAIAGGIIGYNIKDDEPIYIYEKSDEYDFTQLNIYSRYGGEEPEYLKKIK